MAVHSSTGTTPFDLVLSRPPPEFTRDHRPQSSTRPRRDQKEDYSQRLHIAIAKATKSLARTQARYKRDFYKGVRPSRKVRTGDAVFLDAHDGVAKRSKLTHSVAGPFKVLNDDDNRVTIQRGDLVERVTRDRVTVAPRHAITRTPQHGDAGPEHLTAKRTSGRSFPFRTILAHRERANGELEFKIAWDGDYAPTWEPRDCIPEEAISRHFIKYRRKMNSRRQADNV